MKWNNLEESKNKAVELGLRRIAKSLYRFCKRYKLSYADIYLIDSDGSATINLRAKKDGNVIADGYTFVKSRTER